MPRRSKVARLPDALRRELDAKLVDNAFSGYVALSEWLAEQGYTISKSALHKHGKDLERRLAGLRTAVQAAEAVYENAPEDVGTLADAALRLAHERMFALMLAAESGDAKELSAASRALTDFARAALSLRQARKEAGLSPWQRPGVDPAAVLKHIREEVYGITPDPPETR